MPPSPIRESKVYSPTVIPTGDCGRGCVVTPRGYLRRVAHARHQRRVGARESRRAARPGTTVSRRRATRGDLVEAASLGVLEGGDAVPVRDRGVGAGLEEDLHDPLPRPGALAEDHRLQERGPAQVVDVVHVDAGAHDPVHVGDVAALAGRDHRHAAVPVADRQVRVRGQQRLQHRDAAGDAGDQPGGVVAAVEGVRVGAQRDQQPGHVDPVVGGGEQQRRARPPRRGPPDRRRSGGPPRRGRRPRSAAARSSAARRVAAPGPRGRGGGWPPRSPGRAARRARAAGRRRARRGCAGRRRRRRARGPCRRTARSRPPGRSPRAAPPSRGCSRGRPRSGVASSRPTTSAWPRSAARISPVPSKLSSEPTSAPWRSTSSSSSRCPSLVAIR